LETYRPGTLVQCRRGKAVSKRQDFALQTADDFTCGPSPSLRSFSAFFVKTTFQLKKCGGQSWFLTNTMPPERYASQDTFDIGVLNPQALHTQDGLQTALSAIEAVCYRGDSEIARMVETLNSRSYLLEYIISGTSPISGGHCASLGLIVFPSSSGGGGIREVIKLVTHGVPHIRGAKYERHEHPAAPETFIFSAVREVSIRCRYTLQSPCLREKGRTLVQCSKESRGKHHRCFDRGEHTSRQPQKG